MSDVSGRAGPSQHLDQRRQRDSRPGDRLAGRWLFYALLALAGLSILTLLGLVLGSLPLYMHEVANLCRRSWTVLIAHLPAVGAVVPLAGLMFVLGRGWVSLIRQLRDTQRFVQSLPTRERELPVNLRRLAADLEIAARLDLIQDVRAYSFCYGLLRPRICVTTGLLSLLDEAELRALLLHERHHLRQRDPLRILIGAVLADAIGVLPIVPTLWQRYQVAQEVTADQAAIAGCDSDLPLSSALLKLLTAGGHPRRVPATVGAFSVTEERIARLVHGELTPGETPTGLWVATLLIIAGTLLVGYAGLASMHAFSASPIECANVMAQMY